MTLKNSLKTAVLGLKTHKSRSALTMLGIIIGIASIILIMSVGKGAESLILNEISAFGAENIVIRPGKEPTGPSDIAETIFADSLKNRDVEALRDKRNVPGLAEVVPAVIVPSSVSYKGETFRPMVFGWSAEFMESMFNVFPESGTIFGEEEIKRKAAVAVIGSKIKDELFGEQEAVNKNIKIRDVNFRVVGVYAPHGQVSFFNINEMIIIPYTTAQTYLLGIDYYHEIITRAESPEVVKRTVRDIEATLRDLHGITDPEKDDFFVVTQEGVVNQVKTIIDALTIFLSLVVAIALVVGGIGVMNIMLVSVTERTREIGLRKSLGATNGNILTQFLLESVILTAVGGIIGIMLGSLLSFFTSFILTKFFELNWAFNLPLSAVILGFSVSTIVGLVFGIYPARQASLKSPIEALRYE